MTLSYRIYRPLRYEFDLRKENEMRKGEEECEREEKWKMKRCELGEFSKEEEMRRRRIVESGRNAQKRRNVMGKEKNRLIFRRRDRHSPRPRLNNYNASLLPHPPRLAHNLALPLPRQIRRLLNHAHRMVRHRSNPLLVLHPQPERAPAATLVLVAV